MSARATVLAAALAVSGCASAPSRDAADEARVGAALDDFHDAAARADEARYFDHFAAGGVFLGTDASERWDVAAFRAYAHPHFAKGRAWAFHAVRRAIVVDADGAHAWFDEDLATPNLGPARGSGVLVKQGGAWKIAQYNLALTIPNERFGAVKDAATTAQILAAAADDPLRDLGWLAGAWVVERPVDGAADGARERVEEVWLAPAGATMIGSGRTTRGAATTSFEQLRLEVRDGVVVYVAAPRGGAPSEFTRVASDDAAALVVENRGHDWPKRITYRKDGDGLVVRVEGDPGQPVEAWSYRRAVIDR